MWPTWVFLLMLIVAGILAIFLLWPVITYGNKALAYWWRARRIHRDHVQYVARKQAFAREAGR